MSLDSEMLLYAHPEQYPLHAHRQEPDYASIRYNRLLYRRMMTWYVLCHLLVFVQNIS